MEENVMKHLMVCNKCGYETPDRDKLRFRNEIIVKNGEGGGDHKIWTEEEKAKELEKLESENSRNVAILRYRAQKGHPPPWYDPTKD